MERGVLTSGQMATEEQDRRLPYLRRRFLSQHRAPISAAAHSLRLFLASLVLLLALPVFAAPGIRVRPGIWMQQRGGFAPHSAPGRFGPPGHFGPPPMAPYGPYHQEHLPQWFRQHQYLPLPDQERALHREPGFNRLPPPEQQRLTNRLMQLNRMPPVQRQRTLDRMEALERMSPAQRQQVRYAMQQVTQLPEDRRRMMHKAFHDLSQLPPAQRQAVLNSVELRNQFSPHEREMLGTLLSVQPYPPPTAPAPPPPAPYAR